MAEIQAGWYPDPEGDPVKVRYWDGTQWTDRYQRIEPVVPPAPEPAVVNSSAPYYVDSSDQTLRLIAFVFNLLVCIGIGIFIIPLAWCIAGEYTRAPSPILLPLVSARSSSSTL